MPIYEYRCEDCSNEFEELVGISEPPPECPNCNSSRVNRLLSTPSFSLKGDGWYSDHYGLKEDTVSEKSTSGSSDTQATESTTKGED